MGKFDVLHVLEKHPDKWFTIAELSEETGISFRNIRKHVINLEAGGFVYGRWRHLSFTKKPREFKIHL